MICKICNGEKSVIVGWSQVPRSSFKVKWERDPCPGCTAPPHTFHAKQRAALPYVPGDRLYVREAHYLINGIAAQHKLPDAWKTPHLKLRPSIHMPRWASRLTLTVTEVRVQRLQDISEADAWAEGCIQGDADDVGGFFPAEEPHHSGIGYQGWDCARDWYADLWESLHGDGAWDANPWVAAVSFTVVKGNIDEVAQ